MNFSHALAVITGGASGLGRAVAERVIAQGGQAAILDLQEPAGTAAAEDIGARFFKCDVGVESQTVAAMAGARDAMNGINLLVNCAGIGGVGKLLGREGPMAGARCASPPRRAPTTPWWPLLPASPMPAPSP